MSRAAFKSTLSTWCLVTVVAFGCAFARAGEAAPISQTDVLGLRGAFVQPSPASGPLRVLVLGERGNPAHRREALEFAILADYARAHRLQIDWVPVVRPEDVYHQLVRGQADLAIGALPADIEMRPSLVSTHPLTTHRFQLIGQSGLTARDPLALSGLRIGIRLSSPLWSYFEKLQRAVPGLELEPLPGNLPRQHVLDLVADGVYDATVLPTTVDGDGLAAYPRLRTLFDLTDDRPAGWYLRSDNQSLLTSLNRFITRYQAAYFEPAAQPRDFRAIRRRGVLRIVTRVDQPNYYVRKGRPSGYEYELAEAFAAAHDLRLEVLVARDDAQMVSWLKTGAVDLVTTRIDGRLVHGDPSVSFSHRYHHDAYTVLSRADFPLPDTASLRGRRLVAYADSAALRAARSVVTATGLEVVPAASSLSAGTLLARVRSRLVDGIVVDAAAARRLLDGHAGITAGVSLPVSFEYRWLVRGNDPAIRAAVDDFLQESHRDGLNATLVARYFSSPPVSRPPAVQPISPFDRLLQTYAARYDFDWRLIAALAYQESRFDPRAVSEGGAEGLMQMLPGTARALGFRKLFEPESSIHAGVKYLYTLRNEFENEIPISERTWFALAAYNAGYERVERARRLAARMQLDPNRWFGHVETAMLRFAQRTAGRGRDRSSGQAIIYVRRIQSLYGTYLQLGDAAAPGSSPLAMESGAASYWLATSSW